MLSQTTGISGSGSGLDCFDVSSMDVDWCSYLAIELVTTFITQGHILKVAPLQHIEDNIFNFFRIQS